MKENAFKDNVRLLKCPVCGGFFDFGITRIVCEKGHSFDLARQGYVNLLNKPAKSDYDKKLFEARRRITEYGFFDMLAKKTADIILERLPDKRSVVIADLGCGEGTLFSKICALLKNSGKEIAAIGIDISKNGIMLASGKYKEISWITGDLAAVPLQDKSVDIILNILSPANYGEFNRCLKSGAIALKAVPGKDYLCEIRQLIGKKKNDNENTAKLFYDNFKEASSVNVFERTTVTEAFKKDFLEMTPLTWDAEIPEGENDFGPALTLDLEILAGNN